MADTSNFHFYSRLFAELGSSLTGFVNDTASSIIGAITPVAHTMLVIYVILWGWSMMRGVISEPLIDGAQRLVRLTVITTVALQIGYYNGFLADMLWNSPDALASYVAGGSTVSNANFLDSLMSQIYDLSDAFFKSAHADTTLGFPDITKLIIGFSLLAAGLLATAYGAFLLALSKMALAIILGVGPIFILMTIFEGTKKFFDAWLGQALNYVFLVMLTSSSIKLIMSVLQHYLTDANGFAVDPSVDQAVPAIVFSVIGTLVLTQMPAVASALGGGVSISTLGAVGWAYGKAKSGVSAMRPTNLRRSFNKAKSDVRLAKNAATSVAGAPSAVYRRVTGANKNSVSKS